jgi:hypothetical protein
VLYIARSIDAAFEGWKNLPKAVWKKSATGFLHWHVRVVAQRQLALRI